MKKTRIKLFLLIFSIFLSQNIFSQRPKVGLVLSGGGAKGLSHVGILKAIDRAGLKIDFVTGTSMGSIVGAMYAAGYSGKQIENYNNDIYWPDMFAGKPKYSSVSIEEKDEYDKYTFEVPMKQFKPDISTGMIESEEIYLYFSKVFFPFYNKKDFTKFNIPFKCVATDLATGGAVVLENGEIVKAIRASMAIPGVFESVKVGNSKLVDGGIIRNFPVSDCKDMGADYIIGVNLFPGLAKVDELNNAMDVMYQITQYRDAEDLSKQRKLCKIIIDTPLSEYSAGSFGSSKRIENIGDSIGLVYYPIFKHLADSLNAIERIDYNPETRYEGRDSVILDKMVTEGRVRTTNHMIKEQLGFTEGGVYTTEKLDKAFRNAYSSLYYKTITYSLIPTDVPGHAILNVTVRENELAVVKIGISYHSFSKAAIILNFTRRNLFFDKSRSLLKISLGDNIRLLGQHKQFFGRNLNNNIGASLSFDKIEFPIYSADKISYVYSTRKSVGNLNFCHTFGLKNSISLGTSLEYTSFYPAVSATVRYDGYNQNLYSYINYSFNNLNRRLFPQSGNQGYLEGGVSYNNSANIVEYDNMVSSSTPINFSKTPFCKFKLVINKFYRVSSSVTILQNIQGAFATEDSTFRLQRNFLGGVQQVIPNQMPFAGYRETQLSTNSLVSTMVGIQVKTFGELYTIFRANVGVTDIYHNKRWFSKEYQIFRLGASASLGYNLGFFPMELTLMYCPEYNSWASHVSLGFQF